MSRLKTERIAADEKAFSKAKKIVKKRILKSDVITEKEIAVLAAKLKQHRRDCSCNMCCNPRRSKITKTKDKLTIQEKKVRLPDGE